MRLNIRNQVCRFLWVRAFEDDRAGECDDDARTIRVLRSLSDREKLRVVIHELLHAEAWDMSEEWVDRASTTCRDLLWRLGWRPRSPRR